MVGEKKEFKPLNRVIETDECAIVGIGAFELKGYSVLVSVSVDYLKRAIKIIEELHKGEKDISVDLAIAKGYPLVIGGYNREEGKISGIAIAPRVDEEGERI